MQSLSYVSESRIPKGNRDTELSRLVERSGLYNRTVGLTGVLILRGDLFFQTLEGPNDTIQAMLRKIRQDRRHDCVYVIANEPISERKFSEWTMEGFHDPTYGHDYQETLHQLGQFFCHRTDFGPAGLAVYARQIIGRLTANRPYVGKKSYLGLTN